MSFVACDFQLCSIMRSKPFGSYEATKPQTKLSITRSDHWLIRDNDDFPQRLFHSFVTTTGKVTHSTLVSDMLQAKSVDYQKKKKKNWWFKFGDRSCFTMISHNWCIHFQVKVLFRFWIVDRALHQTHKHTLGNSALRTHAWNDISAHSYTKRALNLHTIWLMGRQPPSNAWIMNAGIEIL